MRIIDVNFYKFKSIETFVKKFIKNLLVLIMFFKMVQV
jgi:hypothetical protein